MAEEPVCLSLLQPLWIELTHRRRDIEKSTWVKVAEAMVERWNITFVDRNGIGWIPRLKPVKPPRKK